MQNMKKNKTITWRSGTHLQEDLRNACPKPAASVNNNIPCHFGGIGCRYVKGKGEMGQELLPASPAGHRIAENASVPGQYLSADPKKLVLAKTPPGDTAWVGCLL